VLGLQYFKRNQTHTYFHLSNFWGDQGIVLALVQNTDLQNMFKFALFKIWVTGREKWEFLGVICQMLPGNFLKTKQNKKKNHKKNTHP